MTMLVFAAKFAQKTLGNGEGGVVMGGVLLLRSFSVDEANRLAR